MVYNNLLLINIDIIHKYPLIQVLISYLFISQNEYEKYNDYKMSIIANQSSKSIFLNFYLDECIQIPEVC